MPQNADEAAKAAKKSTDTKADSGKEVVPAAYGNPDTSVKKEVAEAVLKQKESENGPAALEAENARLRQELEQLRGQKSTEKKDHLKDRIKEIDDDKDLDDEEKEILKLHEEGMQQFAIAKKVYRFVNQDTVGRVAYTIRKHYATDFESIEDINSTKGYTGV